MGLSPGAFHINQGFAILVGSR